jgi:4a-hydroxytetrahydrobiopterin dehydratase
MLTGFWNRAQSIIDFCYTESMKVDEWEQKEDTIERTFEFVDFSEALEFVNRVGEISEEAQHHPNILLHSYNKVTISLTTHSEGKVTDKDFDLAQKINAQTTNLSGSDI